MVIVILNTADGSGSHFLMDFSPTLTSTMPRCSGWDVCHVEDEGFQLLSPHYTFGAHSWWKQLLFAGLSYLFVMRGCIKKPITGFQDDFSPSGEGGSRIGATLPLLMLYNTKTLSLRRAAAWQLNFLCTKHLCYQERRKSRLCTWLIWGRCFNPAVLTNTHILVLWYVQQHKVSILQCVRYPDCTSFFQMSSVKLVPYSTS